MLRSLLFAMALACPLVAHAQPRTPSAADKQAAVQHWEMRSAKTQPRASTREQASPPLLDLLRVLGYPGRLVWLLGRKIG